MFSTLAELKSPFRKASLWITLCKTFLEGACKSLINGKTSRKGPIFAVLGLENKPYKSMTYFLTVGFMRRFGSVITYF